MRNLLSRRLCRGYPFLSMLQCSTWSKTEIKTGQANRSKNNKTIKELVSFSVIRYNVDAKHAHCTGVCNELKRLYPKEVCPILGRKQGIFEDPDNRWSCKRCETVYTKDRCNIDENNVVRCPCCNTRAKHGVKQRSRRYESTFKRIE